MILHGLKKLISIGCLGILGFTFSSLAYSGAETPTANPTLETPTWTPTLMPTAKPTRTATFTPTPSPTFNPQPVSELLVNNLTAEHLLIISENDYVNSEFRNFTVDSRNGDLYFITPYELSGTRQMIVRGPLSLQQRGYARLDDVPIIVNSFPSLDPITGMYVMPTGIIYFIMRNEIAKYSNPDQLEVYKYSTNLFDSFDIRDLYLVQEGDNIPYTQPGDLIGLDIRLNKISFINSEVFFSPRLYVDPKYSGINMTLGPDRKLFILATTNFTYPRYYVILRLESNGLFTPVYADSEKNFFYPEKLIYWRKDKAFYVMGRDRYLGRIDPIDGRLLVVMKTTVNKSLINVSYDGESLLLIDHITQKTKKEILEAIHLTGPFPTPRRNVHNTPFPTALPEGYPTLTPTFTPTETPKVTLTPTPLVPNIYDPSYILKDIGPSSGMFAVHPLTGDIVQAKRVIAPDFVHLEFSVIPPSTYQIDKSIFTPEKAKDLPMEPYYDMGISETGVIYYLANVLCEFKPLEANQPIRHIPVTGHVLHVVTSRDRIPNTKPGDILILQNDTRSFNPRNRIVKIDPKQEAPSPEPFVDLDKFAYWNPIHDMFVGPDGQLYMVTKYPAKVYIMNTDGAAQEYTHHFLYAYVDQMNYLLRDHSFYTGFSTLRKFTETGDYVTQVGGMQLHGRQLEVSPDGAKLYFESGDRIYSLELPTPAVTPTPAPIEPTPTPTPIKAWFVLDGFGGIHSTNPNVKPPILPYFWNFNIVRDIEPDPLGRGWYMLDGYGGIHTSFADLPKPNAFPYFGFDIARKLKVRHSDQGYLFYMMDGFGVIHTNDENFHYGYLPWFPEDKARDLKNDPNSDGWLMMDAQGFLYSSNRPEVDWLYHSDPTYFPEVMNSFVRFPDETTVMLDYSGGRHTNYFYPARDVVNGLPGDFYFPGWDIFWDLEVVPENLMK